jgi:hypothetical protein
LTPEVVEHNVEDRELFAPMDEECPAGMVDLVALRQVHVTECVDNVDHPPRMHIDPGAAEQSTEEEKVIEKVRQGIS